MISDLNLSLVMMNLKMKKCLNFIINNEQFLWISDFCFNNFDIYKYL